MFPSIFSNDKKLFENAVIREQSGRRFIANGAQFFNYLGDGTHCSKIFSSPFGFIKDQIIEIENQYNIAKTKSIIKDINIVRSSENKEKWFWYIVIEKLM